MLEHTCRMPASRAVQAAVALPWRTNSSSAWRVSLVKQLSTSVPTAFGAIADRNHAGACAGVPSCRPAIACSRTTTSAPNTTEVLASECPRLKPAQNYNRKAGCVPWPGDSEQRKPRGSMEGWNVLKYKIQVRITRVHL